MGKTESNGSTPQTLQTSSSSPDDEKGSRRRWSLEFWSEKGIRLETEHERIQFVSALEFIEVLNTTKIRTLADIGSGPGNQAFVFKELGLDVTCIDFVKPRYDIPWQPPGTASNRLFDALWSHHCLEHIPNALEALIEWRRLLRPAGRLFLTVPEIGLRMSSGHVHNFNIPQLMYLLAVAGFDCSGKRFTKVRSHLRAEVAKARNYDPDENGPEFSLPQLADYGLFSSSIARSIRETGRFDATDVHLKWESEDQKPNRNALEAYEFVISNIWK